MFKQILLSGSAALALLVPAAAQEATQQEPAAAQDPAGESASNPALETVMKHLPTLMKKSWETTVDINFEDDTGENHGLFKAAIKYQDVKHFSCDLDMDVTDPYQGQQKFTLSLVADGTYVYIDSPDMQKLSQGMLQGPAKIELAFVEKMMEQGAARSGGMNPENGGEGADPSEAFTGMIKDAMSQFTFKEKGSTDTQRRYVMGNDEMKGVILFDKATWFPIKAEIGQVMSDEDTAEGKTGASFVMSCTGTKMVDSFAEGTFTFTAAEGQTVNDLTPMLRGMMGGMDQGGGDEDLEF